MINFEEDFPQEEIDRLIESTAQDIVRRGLETPAVLFLEMNKPLSFVASQALVVGTPLLGALFGAERMGRYSSFLQSRDNVEKLIKRIEELAAEKDRKSGAEEEK